MIFYTISRRFSLLYSEMCEFHFRHKTRGELFYRISGKLCSFWVEGAFFYFSSLFNKLIMRKVFFERIFRNSLPVINEVFKRLTIFFLNYGGYRFEYEIVCMTAGVKA